MACIDCLTVWLGNLFHRYENDTAGLERVIDDFFDSIGKSACDLVIVTNEVGCGIVPENALARTYRDRAGMLNRRVAALAAKVYLCVCGIPVTLKWHN